MTIPDEKWAQKARNIRSALMLLGYGPLPKCLPDEPEACGNTFREHAEVFLCTAMAMAEHHLTRMNVAGGQIARDYFAAADQIAQACPGAPHLEAAHNAQHN